MFYKFNLYSILLTGAYLLTSTAPVEALIFMPQRSVKNLEASCSESKKESTKQVPILEAKAGYFFFTESSMRRVYDHGGLDLQLSDSAPVYRCLHLYGSAEYWEKSGRSLNGHQRTSLWAVPLSLGLRPVIQINRHFQYYLTLGPRYYFARSHNHSSYVPLHMKANGLGLFANTGFQWIIGNHFTIDCFGEYSYARLHFHGHKKNTQSHSAQLSGLTFGGGIGYAF